MTTQLALGLDQRPVRPDETENAKQPVGRTSNKHLRPSIGTGVSKCFGCGEVFNSVSAFDAHQHLIDGRPICTHPLDITDRHGNPKPMVFNRHGLWVTELRDPGAFDGDAS